MAKQGETKFKERIAPKLKALPRSWWLKTQMLATLGIPDYIGCVGGLFVALELKRDEKEMKKALACNPDGSRKRLQAHVIDQITEAGGIGMFVCPETWEAAYGALVLASTGEMPPEGQPN